MWCRLARLSMFNRLVNYSYISLVILRCSNMFTTYRIWKKDRLLGHKIYISICLHAALTFSLTKSSFVFSSFLSLNVCTALWTGLSVSCAKSIVCQTHVAAWVRLKTHTHTHRFYLKGCISCWRLHTQIKKQHVYDSHGTIITAVTPK